ncbi:hypothetical protein [Yoonia algicola]|uniref:Uncharacterized protein n=1 Tax=Yoonia algicola TaxID=3137368 RepID=A0AAN0M2H2_9RHOB
MDGDKRRGILLLAKLPSRLALVNRLDVRTVVQLRVRKGGINGKRHGVERDSIGNLHKHQVLESGRDS